MFTKRKAISIVIVMVLTFNMFLTSVVNIFAFSEGEQLSIGEEVKEKNVTINDLKPENKMPEEEKDYIEKEGILEESKKDDEEKTKDEKENNLEKDEKIDKEKDYVEKEDKKDNGIIVVYKDIKNADKIKTQISSKNSISQIKSHRLSERLQMEKIEIKSEDKLESVLEDLNNNLDVLYAQPDYIWNHLICRRKSILISNGHFLITDKRLKELTEHRV
jgi:hypothetical protein